MKTLAIFLLAHKNLEQVLRLINKFNNPEIDVYVHCDKRWKEGYNALLSFQNDRIFVCPTRHEADLDSWDLVKPPLELYKFCNKNYKYYALISGQDYPLVSVDTLLNNLKSFYPKPIIDCVHYDDAEWMYYKFNRYNVFKHWSNKINKKFKKDNFFRKMLKAPFLLVDKIYCRIKTPKKDLNKLGMELYGGSAWWILPNDVLNYIYKEYESNAKYIKIYSKTHTPEEHFYQTMTMRYISLHQKELSYTPNDIISLKTFPYFNKEGFAFNGHPHIFTINEFDYLKELSQNYYFARKFDINVDAKILDFLDNYVK
ncbi:MAG: hypothetical protein J6C97_00045 [Clostridia bacterium]|nr:hypothetical protein [Clostridia bacterium]